MRAVFYAHCPRCWRRDLSSWSEEHHHVVTLWSRVAILLGAHRFRCEYCRVNFTSFRPRLRRYVRRRAPQSTAGAVSK